MTSGTVVEMKLIPLLDSLDQSPWGRRMACLSAQVKPERFLLAEMMLNGNERFPNLEFYLEESRRDLTVRERSNQNQNGLGALVDWIEAKACNTDCLARMVTGHGGPGKMHEYRELLKADVLKQETGHLSLPEHDRGCALTTVLFAIHHACAVPRHKYYPDFRNRKGLSSLVIKEEARQYVTNVIAPHIDRSVVEEKEIALDDNCLLLAFVLRKCGNQPVEG